MRVMTLNIKGRKQNVTFVKNVLNYVNADVVCFVESGDNPGNNYIGTAGLQYCTQNSSYVAVLTKRPFTSATTLINYQNPYPPGWPDNSGMNNRSLGVMTTDAAGHSVYIVAVHLDSNTYYSKPLNETLRYGQVGAMLQTVTNQLGANYTTPVIMAGDWNHASHFDWSWWVAPGYATLGANAGSTLDGGANWQGSRELAAAGYLDASGKNSFVQVSSASDLPKRTWLGTSYTSPVNHERIDQIWFKNTGMPSNFQTYDNATTGITWATDHAGVGADFTL